MFDRESDLWYWLRILASVVLVMAAAFPVFIAGLASAEGCDGSAHRPVGLLQAQLDVSLVPLVSALVLLLAVIARRHRLAWFALGVGLLACGAWFGLVLAITC